MRANLYIHYRRTSPKKCYTSLSRVMLEKKNYFTKRKGAHSSLIVLGLGVRMLNLEELTTLSLEPLWEGARPKPRPGVSGSYSSRTLSKPCPSLSSTKTSAEDKVLGWMWRQICLVVSRLSRSFSKICLRRFHQHQVPYPFRESCGQRSIRRFLVVLQD